MTGYFQEKLIQLIIREEALASEVLKGAALNTEKEYAEAYCKLITYIQERNSGKLYEKDKLLY